ncbi:hypothetical protein ACJZ2D_014003 [Fusarium nematophilum]
MLHPAVLLLLFPALSVTFPADFLESSGPLHAREISADARHARALSQHPADLVLHSRDLHGFFKRNAGTKDIVYLRDKRLFVPMSSVGLNQEPQYWLQYWLGGCSMLKEPSVVNLVHWFDGVGDLNGNTLKPFPDSRPTRSVHYNSRCQGGLVNESTLFHLFGLD